MAIPEGWRWLLTEYSDRRAELRRHEGWFLNEWQPSMRARLSSRNISRMRGDEFAQILLEWDQDRWRGVARLKSRLTAADTWSAVRDTLVTLTDGRRNLVARLDAARPRDDELPAPHLGPAVITALLHLHAPANYCVWNGTSRLALKYLGLWPRFPRRATFADKYLLINAAVQRCSRATHLSVPVLDRLWYFACQELKDEPLTQDDDPAGVEGGERVIQSRTKRDRGIVTRAKARWSEGKTVSPACVICGWSMDDIYGDAGFGYIEAHHKDSFAESPEQRVTRTSDLVPVCPNCHSVLHWSGFSVSELRKIVRERGMSAK